MGQQRQKLESDSVVNEHQDYFSSVQSLSHNQLFVTPWTTAHQASLSIITALVYNNKFEFRTPDFKCPINYICRTISTWYKEINNCSSDTGSNSVKTRIRNRT